MVQADVQRIIEVYHRNGRFDVQVVPKIIERPNNRVDLVFEIREGEKTGVRSIIFVGNHAYSDYRLKEVIKTSNSNLLSFLQTTDVYDPDRIEADRDLIRRFYLTHGYADVQVVSATGEYDPASKGFIVTFTIEEGAALSLRQCRHSVEYPRRRSRSAAHVLRMQSGDIYNADAVEKTVEDITVEITKHGYPFATVRPRGDRDPQNAPHQRRLRGRRGRARLYRAHQHPRQYAHPRLRDPARVRYLRRRCLQSRLDRSRRAAASRI